MKRAEQPAIRIGELAERAGVNIQTVRYYERRGLLERPVRSTGGHREFAEEAVSLLRGIKAAQQLGFTLAEIQELTATTGEKQAEVRERSEAKIAEIEEKVQALLGMKSALERVIEAECDSLIDCSVMDNCPIRCLADQDEAVPS